LPLQGLHAQPSAARSPVAAPRSKTLGAMHPALAPPPLLLLLLLATADVVGALDNNLSLVPAMGFNNWDEMPLKYKPWLGGFNESEVKRVGHALVSTGMAAKGFVYLNLDCGWSTGYRSKGGQLQVNETLFPSAKGGKGLAPLAAYLHGLHLKLGIYTSGHQCCSPKDGTDGSEGKEVEDAQQFADWGIDYVKDDDCGSSADHFPKMRGLSPPPPPRALPTCLCPAALTRLRRAAARRRNRKDEAPHGVLNPLTLDAPPQARERCTPGSKRDGGHRQLGADDGRHHGRLGGGPRPRAHEQCLRKLEPAWVL
jgi:hypothetical protein